MSYLDGDDDMFGMIPNTYMMRAPDLPLPTQTVIHNNRNVSNTNINDKKHIKKKPELDSKNKPKPSKRQINRDESDDDASEPEPEPEQIRLDIRECLCRYCMLEDIRSNLIAPCTCCGTQKYVHRTCLDDWRKMSVNPNSYYKCEVCSFTYVLQQQFTMPISNKTWILYYLYIARDFLALLVMSQMLVIILGFVALIADTQMLMPETFGLGYYSTYYLAGWIVFTVCVGIVTTLINGQYTLTNVVTWCFIVSHNKSSRKEALVCYVIFFAIAGLFFVIFCAIDYMRKACNRHAIELKCNVMKIRETVSDLEGSRGQVNDART